MKKFKIFLTHLFSSGFKISLILSSSLYAQSDQLTKPTVFIQDMNNCIIDQVKVQSPFILQVEFDDPDKNYEIKNIPGLEYFKHSPCVKNSIAFINNGHLLYKNIYKFILKNDKKGRYSVGPLFFKNKSGQILKLPRIGIVIADETIISSTRPSQAPQHFVKVELDKKSVYVGEHNSIQLKFFDRVFVENPSIIFPNFENIKIFDVRKKDIRSIESIDGYNYIVTEWDVEFYPTDRGIVDLFDIKINFFQKQLERSSGSKGAFRRFGSMITVERDVNVPPLSLKVNTLPNKEKMQAVGAVGNFSQLMISVNQSKISQGQGLVLTVKLCGSGNFEMIDFESLSLPKNFQYYDARTQKIDSARTFKQFEFIVQINESGSYQIPCQHLSYFDPAQGVYKILKSNSLDIIVTSQRIITDEDTHQKNNTGETPEDTMGTNIAAYTILKQKRLSILSTIISFVWYKFFLYFLLFFLIIMMVYRYIIKKYILSHYVLQRYMIFLLARKALKRALLKNDIGQLYPVFLHLFIALDCAHAHIINKEIIELYLKDHNFSLEQVAQWRAFYSKILQGSFAQSNEFNSDILFRESFVWLQKLKEKI